MSRAVRMLWAAGLAMCLWSGSGPARGAMIGPAAEGSEAADALYGQVVGADPASAWHWPSAVAALRPKPRGAAVAEADALRRGLLDLYLLQVAGEDWSREATVARVIATGQSLPPIERDRPSRARWTRSLQHQLQPVWPEGPVPVPEELELLAGRTTEVAPGLWTSTLADGQARAATWVLQLRHAGTVPLAPGELLLRLARGARAEPVTFDCARPRGQRRSVLAPGQTLMVLCRSRVALAADRRDWGDALERLRGHDAGAMTLDSGDLDSTGAASRMLDTLTTAAASPLPAFYQRFQRCESRNRCAEERRVTPSPAQQDGSASSRARALWALKLIAGFLMYTVVARAFGERVAVLVLLGGLCVASLAVGTRQGSWDLFGRSMGSAAWVVVPVLLVASVVVTAVCHTTYKAYAWLFFRERA